MRDLFASDETLGQPLAEAVRYAACAGAIACTQLGVIPSLGTRAQVDQFYATHYG